MSETGTRRRLRALAIVGALTMLALVGVPAAADDRTRMAASVRQAVTDARSEYRIPGMVVLVVRGARSNSPRNTG